TMAQAEAAILRLRRARARWNETLPELIRTTARGNPETFWSAGATPRAEGAAARKDPANAQSNQTTARLSVAEARLPVSTGRSEPAIGRPDDAIGQLTMIYEDFAKISSYSFRLRKYQTMPNN